MTQSIIIDACIIGAVLGVMGWTIWNVKDIGRIQRTIRENRETFDRLINPMIAYIDYIEDGQVTEDGFQQFLIRNYGEKQTQAYLQELHEHAEQVRLKKEVS